jgi:Ca2+-binding EF-hand superfamily protein
MSKKIERPESTSIYQEIRSVFELIDTDNDNILSVPEIQTFLSQFHLEETDVEHKIQKFLDNQIGEINFGKFTELYCDVMSIDLKQEMRFFQKI